MLKIFNKVRRNLLSKNKFSGYLLYALGEVLLVMIGILLAVQVNNWNERRKQRSEFTSALRAISTDLAMDTIQATGLIEYYEENQKQSARIINQEINKENFSECTMCPSLITLYRAFILQKKGFERFKALNTESTTRKDSLAVQINQFYTFFVPIVELGNELVEKDVLGNLDSFQQYDWFVDWSQGRITDEVITYMTESEDFRKKVAAHDILAARNHLARVKMYKDSAGKLLELIEARLGESESKTEAE